ncbi:hypothetical protein D3C72_2457590 [compost metagenome]
MIEARQYHAFTHTIIPHGGNDLLLHPRVHEGSVLKFDIENCIPLLQQIQQFLQRRKTLALEFRPEP